MTKAFDPYHQWLGIPAEDQPPNHYRLLAVPLFEADANVIENAADRQMAHLRVFQAGKHGKLSQQLLNEVAAARVTLLNAEKKAAYDAQLQAELDRRMAEPRQRDGPPSKRPPPAPGVRPRAAHAPSLVATAEFESPVRELGEYHLMDKLGEGGMGTVYKAMHTKLGREVAVKVLTTARLGSESAIARFEREMLAVGRLDHPNIVRAYDAREIDGTRFLVMELVDGLDLTGVLRHTGPLPVADACEVVRQAALGLQCAHEGQLVHRDIQPGNLMLTTAGQVKILDLGLARFGAGRPGEEMISTGMALGTLDYMAPEQASDGHHIDIRADIYSLGCTLYKLLAGRAPFDQPRYAGVMEKVVAHAKHSPLPISRFRRDVPKEVVAILNRMIAKDPGRRFQTPGEVADAVGPFCVGANLAGLLARAKNTPPKAAPSQALENTQGQFSSKLTTFFQAITPGRRGTGHLPHTQPNTKRLALGAAAAMTVAVLAVALVWALRAPRPAEEPSAVASATNEAGVPEQGKLALRLSDEERASTEVWVGSLRIALPDSEPWEIPHPPGTYPMRLVREGYETYEETVSIAAGKTATVTPRWVQQSRLIFEWPADQRHDARLRVDGHSVPLPTDPGTPDQVLFVARPGTRLVWAERRGYLPFSTTVELARGEQHRIAVEWEAVTGPAIEDVAAAPSAPQPPGLQPPPEAQPKPKPEREQEPEPVPPGPTPEDVAAMEAIETLEAKWRAATEDSEQKVAAWDFAGAAAKLDEVRFDDESLSARLARRKEELKRMAALKERMIARIREADPPLTKADLKLRGFAGELTGADQDGITATLPTGREESLPWHDLGTQTPGRLLQLAVDPSEADDWLSGGVFATGIGDVELAERLLARAGEMGVDTGDYQAPLAQAAFDAARERLDVGDFAEAVTRLASLEQTYARSPWLDARRPAVAAIRTMAEHGAREAEAEALYAEAVGYFESEQFFDVRPLVERLKAEYVGTGAVTDDAREPTFAELQAAVADLGKVFSVRQDGKGDFKTIQTAIDAAPPNSLVEIEDNGLYREQILINKAGLTLRGGKRNWPIITCVEGEEESQGSLVSITVDGKAQPVRLERLFLIRPGTLERLSCVTVGTGALHIRAVLMYMPRNKEGLNAAHTSELRVNESILFTVVTANGKAAFSDSLFLSPARKEHHYNLSACYISCVDSDVHHCIFLKSFHIGGSSGHIIDSILSSVVGVRPDLRIEHCNVFSRQPVWDPQGGSLGEGCFSAPPQFRDPHNLDYRLMPNSPGTGRASDGGDVGVRYTPEMIEMVKRILELRARGIIEF